MASSIHLFFLFCLLSVSVSFSHAAFKLPPLSALLFPIRKDNKTLQYYTTLEIFTRGNYVDVVIDLAGRFLWFNCDSYDLSSYHPIPCGSAKCKVTKTYNCFPCDALRPAKPWCVNNTCSGFGTNPFTNLYQPQGFGEDFMFVDSTDGRRVLYNYKSSNFLFSCPNTDSSFLKGLASETKGMLGLARTNISLHTQLASTFKLTHKFALCIPSSNEFGLGSIFIGGGRYFMPPQGTHDFSKSLITTPLVLNPVNTAMIINDGSPSEEYFINVKSIKVDKRYVAFDTSLLSIDKNGIGGTTISTTAPYTILHSSIFKALVNQFIKAAARRKIKSVTPMAPFGACFNTETIVSSRLTRYGVPTIDLVLQGKNAEWKIYGANSMVEVSKDVSCLGFVDGGLKPRTSIVLGGHQLENYLLEFDLASSKLGVSSSLLLHNTSCSQWRLL